MRTFIAALCFSLLVSSCEVNTFEPTPTSVSKTTINRYTDFKSLKWESARETKGAKVLTVNYEGNWILYDYWIDGTGYPYSTYDRSSMSDYYATYGDACIYYYHMSISGSSVTFTSGCGAVYTGNDCYFSLLPTVKYFVGTMSQFTTNTLNFYSGLGQLSRSTGSCTFTYPLMSLAYHYDEYGNVDAMRWIQPTSESSSRTLYWGKN